MLRGVSGAGARRQSRSRPGIFFALPNVLASGVSSRGLVAKTSRSAWHEVDNHRQEITISKNLVHFPAMRYRWLRMVVFAGSSAWWSVQSTGTDANLRGVSVIADSEHDDKT